MIISVVDLIRKIVCRKHLCYHGSHTMKSLHDRQGHDPALTTTALDQLFEITNLLGHHAKPNLTEQGLTRARAQVIWQLHRRGPITQRELSDALYVTARNVTGLIDALETNGLVARSPHPTDRRATLISLTEKGDALATNMNNENAAFARTIFGDIPESDLSAVIKTLDDVLSQLHSTVS